MPSHFVYRDCLVSGAKCSAIFCKIWKWESLCDSCRRRLHAEEEEQVERLQEPLGQPSIFTLRLEEGLRQIMGIDCL